METGNILESMRWTRKSLLSIEDLSSEEILIILDKAKKLKEAKIPKPTHLKEEE